jgi:hypothetical protein
VHCCGAVRFVDLLNTDAPVGAAEGCDLLILFLQNKNQKIAAFGSSYTVS